MRFGLVDGVCRRQRSSAQVVSVWLHAGRGICMMTCQVLPFIVPLIHDSSLHGCRRPLVGVLAAVSFNYFCGSWCIWPRRP